MSNKPQFVNYDHKQMMKKSAFDLSHVKSVSVLCLLHDGKLAGKIVANWSDNPNGSVCTANVHIYSGPLYGCPRTTGTAGGGGYDKLSAAIADALYRAIDTSDFVSRDAVNRFSGCGVSVVESYFSQFGYETHQLV